MNTQRTLKIKDAVAVVTGANRGIGLAFVRELLERGARKIYAAGRDPKGLDAIVALDRVRVVALRLDLLDQKQITEAAATTGAIDLLVNNAGVAAFGSILNGSPELVARDMQTNYFGTLNVIRAFAPQLEKSGGGAIVNLLSVVSLANMPALGGYSASKAASWSMTQAVRAELAKKNISVHAVFPGPVDTDMAKDIQLPKTSPRDVARAVLDGVESGQDDITPDSMSRDVHGAWLKDPKGVERQFGAM
ncbi:MAG TPA: SDR family oxidoreductase [Burkholderiales bacterium]|nr:SDR family oxidoreductase [Burkholderiales bacterium]